MNGTSHSGVLVFDIGGTYMRAGLYCPTDDRLSCVRRRVSPNFLIRPNVTSLADEMMRALTGLAREVLAGRHTRTVSLAFPAPIDAGGNALAVPTLLGAKACFPVLEAARGCWPDARVFVLNDLTAAGYRYTNEFQDFCILTVGSGIGHKVFLGGVPQVGKEGRGGEIGHLRLDLDSDAPLCDCGERGHLGAIASGRGAVRCAVRCATVDPAAFHRSLAAELCGGDPNHLEATILVKAFCGGDLWARAVIRGTAQRLGQALAAIHLSIGIETFIIIGGFSMALGEDYRLMLVECARAGGWSVGQNWSAMIQFGARDDHHALIGGGRYASLADDIISGQAVRAESGPS